MADKFYAGQTDYILELNLLDSGVTGSASAAADSAAEAAASAAVAGAFENYEGVWLSSTTYLIGDSVNHSDSFWISNINTNLNSEPTEFNSDWSDIGANATLEAIAAAEAAEISETNSEDSNLESGDWANRAEDSLTRTFLDGVGTNRPAGNYSALHHAEKASASATTSTNAANAASGDADDAHTDATLALGYKNNAFASEGNAATSEGNAATSESNASTSASTATTQAGLSTGSAVNSEDSNLESEDWANRVEDSLTRTFLDGVGSDRTSGNYSALHHAAKASASASSASSSASAASTSADEAAVYSDYTGPWSSGTTYVIGESVSHSDKLWLATTGSLNSEPTDVNSDWFYLATELEGDSVNYVSGWNALINIPAIPVASIDNKGNYYVVSVEGSTLIDGIFTWKVDDWIVSNGSVWQRVNNSGSVISVSGKDGVVLLDTDDITEATNLFYTEARVDGNSNVSANTSARHTHSNTIVLDNTTASYIVAEQAKLGGIEENATSDQTSGEIEAIVSHDNLQGVSAEEHIDWTVSQGATDIHPDNYDSAGSGVWSSDTPPVDKATYPVWFNTDTGKTWTWYTDVDGGQWVQDVATEEAFVINEAQIAHKADKVVLATDGNLLSMDATGNLSDSGIADTNIVLQDSIQALHSTDALSISGTTISLNKADASSESVVLPIQNKNLLANGDHSISSRGDYATAAVEIDDSLAFHFDTIISNVDVAEGSIQQLAYNSTLLCAPVRYNVVLGDTGNLYQRRQLIDLKNSLIGKTVTYTAQVRTDMPDVVLEYYGGSAIDSSPVPDDELWHTVSHTVVIEDELYLNFNLGVGIATYEVLVTGEYFEIGQEQLEIGDAFTGFEIVTSSDQQLRCGAIDETNTTGTGSKPGHAGDFALNGELFVNSLLGGNEGGQVVFAKAPNGTMTTDPFLDIYYDKFRFVTYEGGTTRTITVPNNVNGATLLSDKGATQTIDGGTSTQLNLVSDDTGMSRISCYGASQGTGAVEVGQSDVYGGGMMYNGDANPAFVTGETADHVTFYNNNNGVRTAVFQFPHSSTAVTFNGTIAASNITDARTASTIVERNASNDIYARLFRSNYAATATAPATTASICFRISTTDDYLRTMTNTAFSTWCQNASIKTHDSAELGGIAAANYLRTDIDDTSYGRLTIDDSSVTGGNVHPVGNKYNIKLVPNGNITSIGSAISMFSTFYNHADKGERACAVIRASFTTGTWGTEQLAFAVGGFTDSQAGTSGPVFTMKNNGNFYAPGLCQSGASDERLKTIKKPITNALDSISKWRTVNFEFNDEAEKLGVRHTPPGESHANDLGLIAQDVEKDFPELVTEIESTIGENYKTLQYDKVTVVLVSAIKELLKRVEELENGR